MHRAQSKGSSLARQGMSDLAIRNWFIIPTIAFLIVFNIFPLLYSLGFSFTDYRAARNQPAHFVGLENYQELLTDDGIWNNFTITAKYVIISVGGQVLVGFGLALLLNRPIPFKGLLTTILLLPMMMSAGWWDCSGSCFTTRHGESLTICSAWKEWNGSP